ncbi:MAG: histidine ammonia-lyase [Bacteroidota bacterium]|jgi:histidine ammonia-lyase
MILPTSDISLSALKDLFYSSESLQLSDVAIQQIQKARTYLDSFSGENGAPVYGVNTGFGSLCNTIIKDEEMGLLQKNLLISHACGMGDKVPQEIVRLMLLLKVKGLSKGFSGVQLETVQLLLDLYNNKMIPVVYEQGSLGASGDLAPLSHLCLPLLGLGEVNHQGKIISGQEALNILGKQPIVLKSKEGLALINGTQFMSAYATYNVWRAQDAINKANLTGAMSLEAYDGRTEPFLHALHAVRPHAGQLHIAAQFRTLLEGSSIAAQEKAHVQDPYSFRCIPQVHGASWDTLQYVTTVIETEINAVTDNPVVLVDENKIISGGHFHGQPLALVLSYLTIAMAEIGSISERRIYKLISGTRNLPAFLTPNPGLNSGFMIVQYTAASIVSQNKQWCTPAVIDTIDSSNGQEDHVSMGANAATQLHRVMDNVEKIIGLEAFTAAQALEFRRPLQSSSAIEKAHQSIRQDIPFIQTDTYMSPLMHAAFDWVRKG